MVLLIPAAILFIPPVVKNIIDSAKAAPAPAAAAPAAPAAAAPAAAAEAEAAARNIVTEISKLVTPTNILILAGVVCVIALVICVRTTVDNLDKNQGEQTAAKRAVLESLQKQEQTQQTKDVFFDREPEELIKIETAEEGTANEAGYLGDSEADADADDDDKPSGSMLDEGNATPWNNPILAPFQAFINFFMAMINHINSLFSRASTLIYRA